MVISSKPVIVLRLNWIEQSHFIDDKYEINAINFLRHNYDDVRKFYFA